MQRWLPVVAIIALVVITFVLLGQRATSASAEHAELAFPVMETGALTLLDGTQVDESTMMAGQQLYTEACAVCHGLQGEGVTGLGSALTISVVGQPQTENELLALIRAGIAADAAENQSGIAMPASGGRPDLTDEELLAIIRYLRAGVRS